MKILLFASLLFNALLGVLYFQEKNRPPLERIVVEEKVSPPRVRTITKEVLVEKKSKPQEAAAPGFAGPVSEKVMEDAVAQVTQDREQFLTETMDLSPEKLSKLEEIKADFSKKFQSTLAKNPFDLSIQQRRRLLDIEAERDEAFIRVMGKEKWEKFQKFKSKYNDRKFKEQSEIGVVVPLEL